ncbi:ABC transporter ATP-binding protein [Janibacter sp. G56]|uniref:ABC transporter ATP-binding protein n=1 Tax=Janibacter sp. G56 TaxID=3418717 RepID=UPI003D011717
MSMQGNWQLMRSLSRDGDVASQPLPPGTGARVLGYARPFARVLVVFLVIVALSAVAVVATPLLLKEIIDQGVIPQDRDLVVRLAFVVGLVAVAEALLTLVQRWYSARIGEGLIYNLRTEVFAHVLRQPMGFFTRSQTGALVSRLNGDVIGAQQAFTTVLSSVVSNALSLVLILGAMVSLSWQLTLSSLVLLPFFLIPARLMGRKLAGVTREQMNLNADMGSRMTERFNVGGALLVKLFGDRQREVAEYGERAARVRDVGVTLAVNRAVFMVALSLVASIATALVYGFGGLMAVDAQLSVGTLLALAALLGRLYGPLTAISNVRVDVMTALVSFSRIFEVLDLEPTVVEAPDARPLPAGSLDVEFDHVSFRYPSADEVSLASLESTATGDRTVSSDTLTDVSFRIPAGAMVALVGPSGAGKTTITTLVARLHDPTSGTVRIGGLPLTEATDASLHDSVGVVTQDAHLFHDTIRENLRYARPEASEQEMRTALAAAQILEVVDSLPAGLDTVVGERGHRLSGGEKQRIAIARLLLKGPGVVVLDEATAHLDSESEAAVQRALETALCGRTALVIAHRLSTIRAADLILVVEAGRIVERGTHEELLAAGGLYRELHRTQYAEPAAADV